MQYLPACWAINQNTYSWRLSCSFNLFSEYSKLLGAPERASKGMRKLSELQHLKPRAGSKGSGEVLNSVHRALYKSRHVGACSGLFPPWATGCFGGSFRVPGGSVLNCSARSMSQQSQEKGGPTGAEGRRPHPPIQ